MGDENLGQMDRDDLSVEIQIIAVTDFCPLKKNENGVKVDTEYFELIKLRKLYFENVLQIAENFDG
jgi:hypothetical protein